MTTLDYAEWAQLETYTVFEGVCLVHGVKAPNTYFHHPGLEKLFADLSDDVSKRKRIRALYERTKRAMRAGTLKDLGLMGNNGNGWVGNKHVRRDEFLKWVVSQGYALPPELRTTEITGAQASERTDAATGRTDAKANAAAKPFLAIPDLKWKEVAMTFISLDAVRVKARGTSETFTFEAMGFKNRNAREATPNMCWDTLRTLAVGSSAKTLLTSYRRRLILSAACHDCALR
jgi:hypothetical protein